jgi:hypothetical protein
MAPKNVAATRVLAGFEQFGAADLFEAFPFQAS